MNEHKSVPERLAQLAKQALQQTRTGALTWRPTDDPDAFLYSGPKTSLIIDKFASDNEFEFRLLNESGVIVEGLHSDTQVEADDYWAPPLRVDDPWATEGSTPNAVRRVSAYLLLSQLHDVARRSALAIDSVLDQAFSDIALVEKPPF